MTGIIVTIALVLLVLIVLALRFYRRATQDIAYVRTGFGGTRTVMGGGALVVPILHNVTRVNMNTMRLEISRVREKAIITGDRLRADVIAEFYVRVRPERAAIALAAQTLGSRTLNPEELKSLVEGKFIDALRSIAAEMSMEDLHRKRQDYARAVAGHVAESLGKNGLELESTSITSLDQTPIEFFNPSNAFDAEGLTRLTEQIEGRKKTRNDIEQDTAIAIRRKGLETEKLRYEIEQDSEYARLQQQLEIATKRSEQQALIAESEAQSRFKADQARLDTDRAIAEHETRVQAAIDLANLEKDKNLEIARRRQAIEVSAEEQDEVRALISLEQGRAALETAKEQTETAREREVAERSKAIEILKAEREAEREAQHRRIMAAADHDIAETNAAVTRIRAAAEAEAARLQAEGDMARQRAEAEAERLLNDARNLLKDEQIAADLRRHLIDNLANIVRESAEPLKSVDSVKILKLDGGLGTGGLGPGGLSTGGGQSLSLPGGGSQAGGAPGSGGGTGSGSGAGGGSLAQQLMGATLDYRAQAPLIDFLLRELGLSGQGAQGAQGPVPAEWLESLRPDAPSSGEKAPDETRREKT